MEQLADDVVVINHGQLVTTGALASLQQAGTSVRTLTPDRLTQVLKIAGATVSPGRDGELVVRGLPIDQIGDRACSAGVALHELAPQAGSLEELFLDWTTTDDPTDDPTEDPTEGSALAPDETQTDRQAVLL